MGVRSCKSIQIIEIFIGCSILNPAIGVPPSHEETPSHWSWSQDPPPVSDGRPRALCRPAGSSDPSTSKEAMNINGWKMLEDVGTIKSNYFTSCDPHHDIYTFSY